MNNKLQFTNTLLQKSALAKKEPTAISSTEVLDGSGAVVTFANDEYGYDLRLFNTKGLLPLNHPVRLASECGLNESDNWEIQEHPLIGFILKANDKKSAKLVQLPLRQSLKYFKAQWYKSSLKFNTSSTTEDIIFELDKNTGLLMTNGDDLSHYKILPEPNSLKSFLDFYYHIAYNSGHGRIADIEKLLKQYAPTNWNAEGLHLTLPFKLSLDRCLEHGLFIDSSNIEEHSSLICLPISIYDYQIADIIKRLKLVGEN